MPTSNSPEDLARDPTAVAAAFHRLYVDSLPFDQRTRIARLLDAPVQELTLDLALEVLELTKLTKRDPDPGPDLVKLRAVASAVRRRPGLITMLKPELARVVVAALREEGPQRYAEVETGLEEIKRKFESDGRSPADPGQSHTPEIPASQPEGEK